MSKKFALSVVSTMGAVTAGIAMTAALMSAPAVAQQKFVLMEALPVAHAEKLASEQVVRFGVAFNDIATLDPHVSVGTSDFL